jgi:hypothetical protein
MGLRLVLLLAALTAASSSAGEMSLNEAANSLVFTGSNYTDKSKPKAGDTRYGVTYIERPSKVSSERQAAYWCILLTEGKTRWQQANDPKKGALVPWYCWYTVETFYHFDNTAAFHLRPPGLGLTDQGKDFLDPHGRQSDTKIIDFRNKQAIGDGAISGVGDLAACVHAVSGPLYLTTRVSCRFQIDISEHLLSKSIAGLKPGYPSDKAWPDKDKLAAEFEKHLQGREAVAVRIAREIVAGWEAWSNRKLGPGPGFRGLYWDLRSCALFPEDMPAGFQCTNYKEQHFAEIRSRPQQSISTYYTRKRGTEQLPVFESQDISIRLFSAHQAKPFDAALDEARAEFVKSPSVSGGTRPETIALNGADEAKIARVEKSTWVYVVARRANVLIQVRGDCSTRNEADYRPMTKQLCQTVLDRLRGVVSPKPAEGVQLVLKAEPPALWADGKGHSRIRLTCRNAAGKGLPGEFTLSATGGGRLQDEKLTANASGEAETEYTASDRPGTSTITATGVAGTCSVSICEGGLAIVPAQEGQWGVLADGKSSLPIVIRATGLDGKPLAGLRVSLTTEEKELPQRGTLAPAEVQLDASGVAQAVYTPPQIAVGAGFRMGDVYVNAAAQATGPPPASLTGQIRLTVTGGEGATLLVQKDGFAPARFPVALASANSLLGGRVLARAPSGETFPLACASLRVVGADGKQGIGAGQTEADGAFSFECVTSPQAGGGEATDLPAPLEVPLDPALLSVFNGARESLNELNAAGFEVAAAARYLNSAPERLARCDPKGDPGQRPAASGGAAYRLGLLAVYIRLIRNRQMEDLDWFMESIDPVVDELVGLVADISELEKQAKEKLGEKFNQVVWQRFKKTSVGRVLRILNVWYRKQTKTLRALDKKIQESADRNEKFDEAIGRSADEGGEDGVTPTGLLHTFVDPLDALTPELKVPDPDGGESVDLSTWFLKTLKRWLRKPLEDALRTQAQGVLNAVVRRFEKAGAGDGSLEGVTDAARNIFTTYQDDHLKLNIRNLDAELYRLDAKLFMDTVVKGVVIYLDARKTIAEAGVKALRNLTSEQFEKIQESVTAGGEKVDKATKFLDGAFRVYQGQAWLRDAFRAEEAIEAIAGELVK